MRASELANVMVVVVDRLVNARDNTNSLERVMETVVGTTGRFNGKDVTNYCKS